jgi:hypothetical protein
MRTAGIAKLDLEIVHFQRRCDRLLDRRGLGVVHLFRLGRDSLLGAAVDHIGKAPGAAA